MLEKVKKAIAEFNMISEGETVLCCLSGGADSVTLLLCLRELGYNIKACHINHQLRGEESQRDEDFCAALCKKLGVPIEIHKADVKGFCSENSCSIEEGARKLRYLTFENTEVSKIATAHTLSDCFETAIFNMSRGTGLKGLCGIPPVRGRIIRPLIYCTRQEIEEFLYLRNQNYVTDSTNLINDCSRNKIRNLVIPILKEINPAAEEVFGRTVYEMRKDEAYLDLLAGQLLSRAAADGGYKAEIIAQADIPIKNRAVIKILSDSGASYDCKRVAEISDIIQNGGKSVISGGKLAICARGIFRIADVSSFESQELLLKAEVGCEYSFSGRTVCLRNVEADEFLKVNKKFANAAVDYDKIKGEIFIRNRQNGDKIRLAGRQHTSAVKKLFNSEIPLELRNKIVMLADSDGLIWVEGFGAAERVKADFSSKRLLICEIS